MMKLAGSLLLLAACAPPTTPNQPVAPLPDDTASPGSAAVGSGSAVAKAPVVWPRYPVIPPIAASQPTGDPIAVPSPVAKVGALEHRTYTGRFEEHYDHDANTRFQLTKRDFELAIKTLAVTKGQPTQLEVTAHKANEWVALADAPTTTPRQDMELLQGTYQVSATEVTRGAVQVEGREQEELAGMFAEELAGGEPMVEYMRAKKLRLGEVVALTEAEKKKFGADDTAPGQYAVALVAADAKTVTYALEIDAVQKPGGTMTIDIRAHGTITFDRATGARILQHNQTHKVEHSEGAIDDSFSEETIAIKR